MREDQRISIIGCHTFIPKEDKPSEVVRKVVNANDDFWAKFIGWVLAWTFAVGIFYALRFASHHF